jgi:SAM-dependent methyltransferase
MNDDMLALARRHQDEISRRIGWRNVEFRKGRIQDLALDLDRLEELLNNNPVTTVADWLAVQRQADELRQQSPMIASDSIDVVLSNCVLNLVHPSARQQLFAELYRVLRPGGRAVISDIVSSRPVPEHLRNDPQLWSGCVSGAHEEEEFLAAFASAGLTGMTILDRQQDPWSTMEGIEFRSVTVQAYKPQARNSTGQSATVIYRGPWRTVVDDAGCELVRGRHTTVSCETFQRLSAEPFATEIIAIGEGSPHPQPTTPGRTPCCP